MGFLHLSLLAGSALVALPIVLHLIMRREPQRVEFPALRFVRKRQATNQTRLKLRHWLLLALRCAVIVLLAFSLARPVLRGSGLLGNRQAGLAAALVLDTSPRMQYRERNTTRLDEAKDLATWLLEQLPREAEVAVVDPNRPRRAQLGDLDTALLRTERIRPLAAAPPLGEAVVEAIRLTSERPDHRREVYVFTDMASAVWNETTLIQVKEALDRHQGVDLYVVNVGVDAPQNRGLGELELSSEHLSTGEALVVRAQRQANGTAASEPLTVELWIESGGEMRKRGEQQVGPDQEFAEFVLNAMERGVHQGYLEIAGDDPLPIDNRRFFTVEVRPPARLLLAGRDATAGRLLGEALAPSIEGSLAAPRFAVERTDLATLERGTLAEWDGVWLVDPPPLTPQQWRNLADFAQAGGGVAISLGANAVGQIDQFNTPEARVLMPGPLKWVTSDPTGRTYLQPVSYDHPLFRPLIDVGNATPWPAFPILKWWEIGPLDPSARVVATLSDGSAAVIEGVRGTGRVLTTATPLSERASGDPWNLLATNPDPWPYLAMAEGMADYLVGTNAEPLNILAGDMVSLALRGRSDLATFVLEPPVGDPLPQSLSPGQTEIVITSTRDVGNYRVTSGGERALLDRGFSVNARGDVGQLAPIPFDQIAATLGKNRVKLATDRGQLTSSIDLGRVGRELYPWFISLLALALACEQLLSDRFYARRDE